MREAKPSAGNVMSQSRKSSVKLSHPDRVYWPDEGITKQNLADYYSAIWPRISPFVVGRPLALLRAPAGIGAEMFFQKHAWRGMNKNIALVDDPAESNLENSLITLSDLDGLVGLVQAGVLELHPWGSTTADIEHPDMIIMDLDPGEGVSWHGVIDAAFEVKQRLEAEGLIPFVKTSGGKGLHVVAPLVPRADWSEAREFAHRLASEMADNAPDRYVATVTKSKRDGKILLDYLRNGRGNTAVAPYSTRARKGAPVSMPLSWEELPDIAGPASFTVMNATERCAAQRTNPWEAFLTSAKPLAGAG